MVNLSTYPGGGRKNAVAFTIGTKAYVGLGQNLTVGVFNDFYQFDPQTRDSDHPQGTWIKMSNLPPAAGLAKAVSFVLEGVGFVTTGIDQNNTYQKSLWMYLPPSGSSITGAWVQRASFPGTKRIDATGFAIENFGYVGTGFDGTTLLNDFWMYNPYLNTWTPKAPFLGTPRREAVGAGLDFGKDLNGNEEYRGYLGTGLTGDPITPYTGTFYYYQP
jgi:N-acetylneuraminic acid mutarotase